MSTNNIVISHVLSGGIIHSYRLLIAVRCPCEVVLWRAVLSLPAWPPHELWIIRTLLHFTRWLPVFVWQKLQVMLLLVSVLMFQSIS